MTEPVQTIEDDDLPTFGSSTATAIRTIRLRLIGVDTDTGDPVEVVLSAWPSMPTGAFLDVMEASEKGGTGISATLSLLRSALQPDSEDALDEFLHRPGLHFDLNAIGGMVEHLVKEWTARPTVPPASSRAGRRSTERGSTGRASSRAVTGARSLPATD